MDKPANWPLYRTAVFVHGDEGDLRDLARILQLIG